MLVRYSDGKEEEDRLPTESRKDGFSQSAGATFLGLFGPLLEGSMSDISKGKIGLGHWEQGPGGHWPCSALLCRAISQGTQFIFCCIPAGPGENIE